MRLKMVWKVTVLNLKNAFGLATFGYFFRKRDVRFLKSAGIFALIVLALAPLFYIYLRIVDEVYEFAVGTGQEGVVITMGLVLASFLVFIFGIAYVISTFYFSRDLDFLIPLPLRPGEVLAGKFGMVLATEYITIAPFVLPAFLVYGLRSEPGLLFWFLVPVIYFLVPLIPLALASLLVMVLMSITNLSRKKDFLQLLGMFILVLMILAFNFLMTRVPPGEEMELMMMIFQDPEGLINYVGRAFPTTIWATKAMIYPLSAGQALNFLGFSGISVLALWCMMWVADVLFYRGLIGGQEVEKGRVLDKEKIARKLMIRHSPIVAIAQREMRILIRTPIYMFNSVAILVIAPLAMGIPYFTVGFGQLEAMLAVVDPTLINLAGVGFIALMSLFVPALSSSISREGRLFRLSQVIPVHPFKQLLGKLLYGFMLTLLAVPLLILGAFLFLPWGFWDLVFITLMGLVVSGQMLVLSLIIDLMRPYLTWDNPQQAIKQNMNVLFAMVLGAGLLYIYYLMVERLMERDFVAGIIYVVVAVISLAVAATLTFILHKMSSRRYNKIVI